eukprot:4536070-Amphidinium_carterae.2
MFATPEGSATAPIRSESLGPHNLQVENHNGRHLRVLCERHHLSDLCVCNTYWPTGPSYYAANGESASTIDYVFLPSSLQSEVSGCSVLLEKGDALQLMACAGRRDHRPLEVCFCYRS